MDIFFPGWGRVWIAVYNSAFIRFSSICFHSLLTQRCKNRPWYLSLGLFLFFTLCKFRILSASDDYWENNVTSGWILDLMLCWLIFKWRNQLSKTTNSTFPLLFEILGCETVLKAENISIKFFCRSFYFQHSSNF